MRALLSPIARPAAATLAAALLATAVPASAAAPTVRLFDQVPRPGKTLDALEDMGATPPLWAGKVEIPYDAIETKLDELVRAAIPKNKHGKATCDDPCADVKWRLKLTPKVTITKKGQPKVKGHGEGSNTAWVEVKAASEVRIDVHGEVHAETWADSADVEFDAFVVIAASGFARVGMWPAVNAAPIVKLELKATNLDLELNGVAIEIGAKLGSLAGTTPFGIAGGGPIALGFLGGVLGNAAADIAEAKIQKIFRDRVKAAMDDMLPALAIKLEDAITMGVDGIVDTIDAHYYEPLPHVNQSVAQLASTFGASLQVHTVSGPDRFDASAVVRFAGTPSTGKVVGSVRIPKTAMVCVEHGDMVLPVAIATVNADLATKVGASCQSILGPDAEHRQKGVRSEVYLGANPQRALGPKATKLPSWKAVGAVAFTGTLTESRDGKAYQCTVQVTTLPRAAFVALTPNGRLAERQLLDAKAEATRLLVYPVGNKSALLDASWKPTTKAVLDDVGTSCSGAGAAPVLTPSQAEQLLQRLEGCPECGLRRKPGDRDVLEVTDLGELAKDPIGKIVADALRSRARR